MRDLPMRYRFIRTMLHHNISEFTPTDVKTWLSICTGGRKVHSGTIYNYTLYPLMEERFIVRSDLGWYIILPEAKALLKQIEEKRSLKDVSKELAKWRKEHGPEPMPISEEEKQELTKEDEEFARYLKGKIQG